MEISRATIRNVKQNLLGAFIYNGAGLPIAAGVFYTPDVIVVEHGKPVRLSFLRQETTACSEQVVFPDFARRAQLPEGELVPVEFSPDQAGEYEFTCGTGKLLVK